MFTNKLKKAPTPPGTPGKSQSSSLQRKYVASSAIVSAPLLSNKSPANAVVVIPPNTIDQAPEHLRPQTSAEQYWAVRALKAETILQARTVHHRELQSQSFSAETKRSREIAALSKAHEAKQASLEKFVIALLACLGFLILAFIYLLSSLNRKESSASRRSLPYHFTVPILSPFTSVVEHETSAIGTRSITVFVMTLAILVYFIFRRWMMHAGAA